MDKKFLLLSTLILFSLTAFSQDSTSADGLFQMARTAAFEQKDYPTAIRLSNKALSIAPRYTDIRVFLGRAYAWNKQYDSARSAFEYVLAYDAGNADALSAYADIEYWEERYEASLALAERGLQHHPDSESLLMKKTRALYALKRYAEASTTLDRVLAINKGNTEARALAERLKEAVAANSIGISYDYTHFDKQFADPWHIASLSYGRQTSAGSLALRLNYGNRFRESALQYEADFYPRLSKTFYGYLSFGYSADNRVFPKYRGGASLYMNLPRSFEAELGTRFLYFSAPTWMYTVYLGKYYRQFLFGARAYLTPSDQHISQSYNISTRYYYGGAEDYLHLNLGTGISPDERSTMQLLNTTYKLKSHRASLDWKKSFRGLHSLSASLGWLGTEYLPGSRGNQYNIGLGYQKRF